MLGDRLKISIHAPRTGSDKLMGAPDDVVRISIHAPRTGSDDGDEANYAVGYISIHAPRTGSDSHDFSPFSGRAHFNPRSPHGERRAARASDCVLP